MTPGYHDTPATSTTRRLRAGEFDLQALLRRPSAAPGQAGNLRPAGRRATFSARKALAISPEKAPPGSADCAGCSVDRCLAQVGDRRLRAMAFSSGARFQYSAAWPRTSAQARLGDADEDFSALGKRRSLFRGIDQRHETDVVDVTHRLPPPPRAGIPGAGAEGLGPSVAVLVQRLDMRPPPM